VSAIAATRAAARTDFVHTVSLMKRAKFARATPRFLSGERAGIRA
jgi:hypothetical protein